MRRTSSSDPCWNRPNPQICVSSAGLSVIGPATSCRPLATMLSVCPRCSRKMRSRFSSSKSPYCRVWRSSTNSYVSSWMASGLTLMEGCLSYLQWSGRRRPGPAGQCAVLRELLVGECLPATVLDRDPGQGGAERGEAELHLCRDGRAVPGHHEPVGRRPGEQLPPVHLGAVRPNLVDAAARTLLDDDVPDPVLSGGERVNRPPGADRPHERVERVPDVAADQG